jgi:hypothetical protein
MAEFKKFTLRIPEELHGKLTKLADEDDRSLHAEILSLLKEALKAREEKQTKAD